MLPRHITALAGIGEADAEFRDHFVVAVEQRDFSDQVGHQQNAVALVEMARALHAIGELDVLPFEREPLQAMVVAVGHDEQRRVFACGQII